MGNASSQLLNPADDRVDGHSDSTDSDGPDSYDLGTDLLESDSPDSPDSDGPDVGLPMSPYMSRAFGSPMSPLPGDEDDNGGGYTLNEPTLPSPPAKKKQKKRRKKAARTAPENDQQNDKGWLHKREEDELDGAALVPEKTPDDEPLPDLLPSQVKSEHQSDTDSDSDAPSGDRLADESLSPSRPESVENLSQGPEGVEMSSRTSTPYSGPPSTGSDHSIPPELESQTTHPLEPPQQTPTDEAENASVRPTKKQARDASPKPTQTPDVTDNTPKTAPASAQASPSRTRKQIKSARKKVPESQSNGPASDDEESQVMADWLEGSGRGDQTPENHVPQDSDLHDGANGNAGAPEPAAQPSRVNINGLQATVPATAGDETAKIDSIKPEQPKVKKRRRKLQPTTAAISLSQLEGDDDASEVGVSRAPSVPPQQLQQPQQPQQPPKPRARKKKRTGNEASEDEMETLLAAGPSKTRKQASKRDPSDNEDIRAAKRKRLSKDSGGAATGPWTAEELEMLAKLYAEFRDANGMTDEALTDMIHERPDKANQLHQDFWNQADVAISQRARKQIVERTRRLYHNFTARGTWTDEQKDEIHELFETHGKKFSVIAGLINRDQKDVRDYWRNHYLVLESQVKRRWTKEEETRLREVVEEGLSKIRIQREHSGELRTRARAAGDDDESLLDWHQVSLGMDLTRSRAQCKWKWTDMREKGLVGGDGSSRPPTQAPSSPSGTGKRITDISGELIQAREALDKMTDEDKRRLIEAIHDCKASDDANIPWSRLVNGEFRAKWTRPTLRLAWYRLRRSVPDYEENTVEDNARYLLNHLNNFEEFPLIREGHIDDVGEEKLVQSRHGARLWKRHSQDLKAIAARQRRASKMRRDSEQANDGVVRWLRENSVDLGDYDGDGDDKADDDKADDKDEEEHVSDSGEEDVPIRIPRHLKGEAAKRALAEARANANGKVSRKSKSKEPALGFRSASVAIDSESE